MNCWRSGWRIISLSNHPLLPLKSSLMHKDLAVSLTSLLFTGTSRLRIHSTNFFSISGSDIFLPAPYFLSHLFLHLQILFTDTLYFLLVLFKPMIAASSTIDSFSLVDLILYFLDLELYSISGDSVKSLASSTFIFAGVTSSCWFISFEKAIR